MKSEIGYLLEYSLQMQITTTYDVTSETVKANAILKFVLLESDLPKVETLRQVVDQLKHLATVEVHDFWHVMRSEPLLSPDQTKQLSDKCASCKSRLSRAE